MINFKKFELQLLDSPRRVGESWTLQLAKFSLKNSKVYSLTRRVGELPTRRLAESGSHFSIMNISANSKPKSEGLERDLWGTNFCKNPRQSASLPCPFKWAYVAWRAVQLRDYTLRGQSYVWSLPKYWPPTHREIKGNRPAEGAWDNRWKVQYILMCFILICNTIFDQSFFECFTKLPV